MPELFKLTTKQEEALRLLPGLRHFLLFGGSRSAKTFLHLRTIATRAIAAPASRHAVLRFRFNHVKASVVYDTWPKMMKLCFPRIPYQLDKTDWFAELPNASQVWFGGLDEKERTEKILGNEYATILLNEVSQIPYASRELAMTRLAQKCTYRVGRVEHTLRLLELADCNPPSKAHWSYKLYIEKKDPDTREPKKDAALYGSLQMNPVHNAENLAPEYLEELGNLSARARIRFRDGLFSDGSDSALWTYEGIEKWRDTDVPELQRIVVGVDPSGSDDEDNAANDEIGIIVAGLGIDGNAYVLEDLTLKAGPDKWGSVSVNAYDRHDADVIVGETNFGGAMVGFVVQAAGAKPERKGKQKPIFKKVTASRGKVVRAEPISVLHEQGKVRFAGKFTELEEELCGFTTTGYNGSRSPNRADAMIWAISEIFPGLTRREKTKAKPETKPTGHAPTGAQGWMG